MANLPLTGNSISSSYQGLIKTSDNTALSATEKPLTDGLANALPMTAGTAGVSFTGGVDFTSATVTGLPASTDTTYDLASAQNASDVDVTLTGSDATVDTIKLAAGTNITLTDNGSNQITIDAAGGGAAGLVSGTGTDSMQSAASLTTNPANAAGTGTIAIGDDALVTSASCGSVSIGDGTKSCSSGAVALGRNSLSTGIHSIAIGGQCNFSSASGAACATGTAAIAIGTQASASGSRSISIGEASCATGTCSISIGRSATAVVSGIAVGCGARSTCDFGISIGESSNAAGRVSIGVGVQACTAATAGCSIALGWLSCTTAANSVAIGCGVTAAKADTVTVKELETCIAGGGITIKSPNGTEYKLTVSDAGALVIT